MRRLVVVVLVLAGLGYLAKEWKAEQQREEPAGPAFAERPDRATPGTGGDSLEPEASPRGQDREGTPAEPVQRPEPAARPDDGTLAGPTPADGTPLDLEPRPASQEELRFDVGGGDPLALPLCLMRAWRTQDADLLAGFLNEGAGKDLPLARQKLMLAFWRALRGDVQSSLAVLEEIEGDPAITSAQFDLARRAAGRSGPVPASMRSIGSDPLARAMRIVLGEVEAERASKEADPPRMARALSDLMLLELGASWAPRREVLEGWGRALLQAQAGHRLDPAGNWPYIEYRVQSGDTLAGIRKKVMASNPGLNVCVGLIREANGLGEYIHEGDVLRIPTSEVHVLVDLDARTLFYMHGDEIVRTWVVGIGREGQETPIGDWTIGEKLEEPAYMPVGRKNLPFGHPENPLGTRWLGLYRDGRDTSYGIHGTGEPGSVGDRVSEGCVRMRNDDVEVLFDILPLGARVRIQP